LKLVLEYTIHDLTKTAVSVIEKSKENKIFLFSGEMGSGKTTLIKSICEQFGIEEIVSSPTYSIVNVYKSTRLGEVYHFDLFRLKNEQEAEEIGIIDYLDSGNICIIEWPEIAPTILKSRDYIAINLSYLDNHNRLLTLSSKN
jgi:tRNA threonylcarbamoyladenosine biosynthesis protein TsaE